MDEGATEDITVCVVTHPLSHASEAAIGGLLEVISGAVSSVSLITANLPDDSEVWNKYDVREVSGSNTGESVIIAAFRFVLNQVRMCQELQKRDEEIVLFFGAVSYILPILFARLIGKAVIVEPRGNVPDSLYQIWADRMPKPIAFLLSRTVWLLERIGYLTADAIIVLSPSMGDDLGLRKPRYEAKLYEHGARPVDVDRFRPRIQYQNRPKRIGYLGRLDEEKGVDLLTEIVKHLPEEINFIYIGDGSLRPLIEDELGDRLESGSVRVTGWVDHGEVPEYLSSLRLLVMTSRTEGVPTTALEAMACGTPVISTPVGGIPDVVEEGVTGYLLDTDGSPSVHADRIESVLENQEGSVVSDRCREFVTTRYSFGEVVEEYKKIFSEVVK